MSRTYRHPHREIKRGRPQKQDAERSRRDGGRAKDKAAGYLGEWVDEGESEFYKEFKIPKISDSRRMQS